VNHQCPTCFHGRRWHQITAHEHPRPSHSIDVASSAAFWINDRTTCQQLAARFAS
jgi:hypothetical protein